jgi:hypothetical protein
MFKGQKLLSLNSLAGLRKGLKYTIDEVTGNKFYIRPFGSKLRSVWMKKEVNKYFKVV